MFGQEGEEEMGCISAPKLSSQQLQQLRVRLLVCLRPSLPSLVCLHVSSTILDTILTFGLKTMKCATWQLIAILLFFYAPFPPGIFMYKSC